MEREQEEEIRALIRAEVGESSHRGKWALASASPTAQGPRGAGGIGQENIRKGFMSLVGGAANYTISGTAIVEVDSVRLAGVVYCSGRPVKVSCSGIMTRNTAVALAVYVMIDGILQPGRTMYHDGSGNVHASGWVVAEGLTPGPHRFAMVANCFDATGSGTLYSDPSTNVLRFLVEEK